jgi:hypothetical protein
VHSENNYMARIVWEIRAFDHMAGARTMSVTNFTPG